MYHVLLSLEESVESVQALGIDLSVPDMGQLGDNYGTLLKPSRDGCGVTVVRFASFQVPATKTRIGA